jgi:hypothetical protein
VIDFDAAELLARGEARSSVTFIDDTMKASILALYYSAVHIGLSGSPTWTRFRHPR